MNLSGFRNRVKRLRALRGAAMGFGGGGLVALVYGLVIAIRQEVPSWWVVGGFALAGVLVGAAWGFFRRLRDADLVASIDRRAGLEDRLTTAREVADSHAFSQELHADAGRVFKGIEPKQVFPSVWKWQDALLAAPMLCSALLVGYLLVPPVLSPEAKREREAMAQKEAELKRIVSPVEEKAKEGKATEAEKRLVQEIQRLRQDLQNPRTKPEEALERANALQKQAEQSAQFRKEQTLQNLAQAESANAKMALSALEKQSKISPEDLAAIRKQLEDQAKNQRELAAKAEALRKQIEEIDKQLQNENLSASERQSLENQRNELSQELSQTQAEAAQNDALQNASSEELQAQQQSLQGEQQALQNQLNQAAQQQQQLQRQLQNQNLTPEQRAQMEQQMQRLQELQERLGKELAELQERMQEIMNIQSIREMMEQLNNHPAMQEMREMAEKLQQNTETQELTKEQIQEMMERMEELQQQLEDLAQQLQDPEALEEFMRQMREAMENAEMGGDMGALGLSLGMGMGMMPTPMAMGGPGSPGGPGGEDRMDKDTGQVNKSDRDKNIKDNAIPTRVTGARRDQGSEAFIEVRGPTGVGNRTSVPYSRVLPAYRQRAEKAVANQKIPKQHERRVKRYFDSLGGNP